MTPLDHALAYAALGWRVVPIPPGFKYPRGVDDWQTKATTDADRLTRWWRKHPEHGVGIATGPGSGIVAIDIDSYAGGDDAWRALEAEHGAAPETVEAITGGGGRHVLFGHPLGVTIVNSHALPPGIDVRGDGGQIVVAPSVHPTSGKAYAWEVEHDPLDGYPVADMPPWLAKMLTAAPVEQAPRRERPAGIPLGGESIVDTFNATHTWPELLEPDGWTFHSRRCIFATGETYELWTRPGKAVRDGASASLYYMGGDSLKVFTSAAHPLVGDEAYTKFGYEATMRHGGDMAAMGRCARQGLGGPQTGTQTPKAGVQSEHAMTDRSRVLPDDLWHARPMLTHIKQAALARLISPDGVLGAVLARTVALSHHTITLPPIIGREGGPEMYVANVASPGMGKGASMDVAGLLMPPPGILGSWLAGRFIEAPVGSGEGIVKLFFDTVTEANPNGKDIKVQRQVAWNALLRIDEVESLERLSKRQDQTTMTVLRSAWSRETLGAAYSDAEKDRRLPAGMYRLGVVMGVQPSAAGFLLDDHGTGTPQRFVFVSGTHPDVSDANVPEWPGPLGWRHARPEFGNQLEVATAIVVELRARHASTARGEHPDPQAAHAGLRQLKIAAALAMLDGRVSVTLDDWALATVVSTTSDRVRDGLREDLGRERERIERASDSRAGRRRLSELEAEATVATRHIEQGAAMVRNRLLKVGAPMTWRDVRDALGSRYKRDAVAIREHAEEAGLIVVNEEGQWTAT